MSFTLVTAPAAEPLTPAEVRTRLSYGAEVTDDMLNPLIKSARQSIDGPDRWIGRALITQTWKWSFDSFPQYDRLSFLLQPVQSITSVKYYDGSHVQQTLDPATYAYSDSALSLASGARWPQCYSSRNVEIIFVAGYGNAGSDVPEPIRCAIAFEVQRLRSLMARDPGLMVDNVIGVASRTYAVGRDGGADGLSAASRALLSDFKIRVYQ